MRAGFSLMRVRNTPTIPSRPLLPSGYSFKISFPRDHSSDGSAGVAIGGHWLAGIGIFRMLCKCSVIFCNIRFIVKGAEVGVFTGVKEKPRDWPRFFCGVAAFTSARQSILDRVLPRRQHHLNRRVALLLRIESVLTQPNWPLFLLRRSSDPTGFVSLVRTNRLLRPQCIVVVAIFRKMRGV